MNINKKIDELLGNSKVVGSLVFLSLIFAGFQHNFNFLIEIMALVAAFLTLRKDWSWLGYIALGWILFSKLSIWQIPMAIAIYLLWRRASVYGALKVPKREPEELTLSEEQALLSSHEEKRLQELDAQEADERDRQQLRKELGLED